METRNHTDKDVDTIREYGCRLADLADCGDRFELYLLGSRVFSIDTYHPGASDCFRVIRCEPATEYDLDLMGVDP